MAQMNANDVEVLVFDYDGTLRDSMNPDVPGTKPSAFARSVVEYQPSLNGREKEIAQIYFDTSGTNRVRQLHIVEERLRITAPVPADQEKEWSRCFDSYIDEKKMPLFSDALPVVSALKQRGYTLSIGSSVPQAHLEEVVRYNLNLKAHFDFILGNQKWNKNPGDGANFIKGLPYIAYVCGKYGVIPNQVAFIGDAPEDMKERFESGTYTVGRIDTRIPGRREVLAVHSPDLLVETLTEMLAIFPGVKR